MGAGHAPPVRVEVLGPLRLLVDGSPVEVRGPKRRAVLALLALAEGRVVTVDHLLAALWPSELPDSGRQALHNHVSRVRTHLGSAATRLQTHQDGYRLELGSDELDAARARGLLAAARTTARRDPVGAFALLREARGLWRGPVLADLTDAMPIAAAVAGFAQLHRELTDALISSAIAAGEAEQVLGLAAASLAADPLREPAVLLLMRTLAAVGQPPEALRVAREYRHGLVQETGLDPSPALGELERDILRGTVPGATLPVATLPGATLPGGAVPGGTAAPARTWPDAPVRSTTRLLGREEQVAAIHRLLAAERLVTLVGPGGMGKSRVALEVARQSGAATVLLLATVSDPAAIPHALAAALDVNVVQGDVLSACVAVLSDYSGLLVIDNCEHLLDPVRDTLSAVLTSCPRLSVLATSREPLGLAAEYTWRLAPLPLPRAGDDLPQVPSVALFLDRAGRVRPGPPPAPAELHTIADIVRRLDGMPLAIELAAGRLSTFSLTDLHDRLDRSLDLLGGGRPSGDTRHRTLRATIAWSYQLLTDDERRLFRHLSRFVGGVALDTAERLAADLALAGDPGSLLARLVDTSMIDARFDAGTRFHVLETLRAFGMDRLAAAGEEEAAAARMIRWAVELTGWLGTTMPTEREPEADAVLRRELPNLRAAWRLARGGGTLDAAAAMVAGLYDTIAYRDLLEVREWAEELAEDPGLASHPGASSVLAAAAEAAYHRGDYRRADRLARAGLEKANGSAGSWQCLMVLAVAELARGAYTEVVEHSRAAADLAGEHREHLGIAALATAYAGDLEEARRLNERGLAGAVSPSMRSWGSYVAGEIESLAGDRELAEQLYLRAIELARASGATFLVGVANVGLVAVLAAASNHRQALGGYREVVDYFARTGDWNHLWVALRNLADLLRRLGDGEPAALIDAAADQAPDAPAVDPARDAGAPARTADATTAERTTAAPTTVLDRANLLDVARAAIERHLTGS